MELKMSRRGIHSKRPVDRRVDSGKVHRGYKSMVRGAIRENMDTEVGI